VASVLDLGIEGLQSEGLARSERAGLNLKETQNRAADQIELDGHTYTIFTDDPSSRVSEFFKKQYPDYFGAGRAQRIAEVRNHLKDDHPNLFEGGICTADKMRRAGLILTERIKFFHTCSFKDRKIEPIPDYLLIPSYQPNSLRIERAKPDVSSLLFTIFRDEVGNILKHDLRQDGDHYYHLGKGDEIMLMSLMH
jgi:hypothetical protein